MSWREGVILNHAQAGDKGDGRRQKLKNKQTCDGLFSAHSTGYINRGILFSS